MTTLNMHSDVFDQVQQFRSINARKVKLNYESCENQLFLKKDAPAILRALREKVGDSLDIELTFPLIPLTSGGKYRFVIQGLDTDTYSLWQAQTVAS